jgi:hypothetical protein
LNNSHHPTEALKGSKFSQLLAQSTEELLPETEKIKNQSELSDFRDNPVFAFIIGAAIEARQEEINSQMTI